MKKVILTSILIVTGISMVLGAVILFLGRYMHTHNDDYFYWD